MQHVSLCQPSKSEIYYVAIFPYIYTRQKKLAQKYLQQHMNMV